MYSEHKNRGVYALCLKVSSVFSIIVALLFMHVGNSPAHRNSSGSGNYEGNGAISEVMGLALHTGLALAFLCCTITQYLVLLLSTTCIQAQDSRAPDTGFDPSFLCCTTTQYLELHTGLDPAFFPYIVHFLYYHFSTSCTTTNTSIQGPAYWI